MSAAKRVPHRRTDPISADSRNRLPWLLAVIASVVIGVAALFSVPFSLPKEDLDPSWFWALHEAFVHGLRFGGDLVFTFGPFGFLYGRVYHPQTFPLVVALKLGLLLIMIWSLFEVTGRRSRWFLAVPPFLLLVSVFPMTDDAAWAFLQFCLCVALTRSESRLFGVAAGMGMALISLAKFMFLPTSVFLVLVLLVFGNRGISRWFAGSFLCATPMFWLAIGQNLTDLPHFMMRSMEITGGYSEAMGLEIRRPLMELPKYLLGCLILVVALLLPATKKDHRVRSTLAISIFTLMICFVFFKHGFVRHDGHANIAYSVLALLALGTMFTALVDNYRLTAVLALFVTVNTTVCFSDANDCAKLEFGPIGHLTEIGRLVTAQAPPPWKGLRSGFELAKEAIRARNPLPAMEGSADVISYNQGVLFAYGMQWKPRPVFQSYSAYTPGLITLNGSVLAQEGADNLLVKIQPIDGHLAAQEDSLVWRTLLDWYESAGTAAGFALLKRRTSPSEWISQEILVGSAKTGQPVRLPETQVGSCLWVTIDLDETVGDRLLSALYKPSETSIVTLGSRGSKKHRYLVAAGRAGFIISPRIMAISDLQALLAGQMPAGGDVRAFSLERGRGYGERSYQYRVSLLRKPE